MEMVAAVVAGFCSGVLMDWVTLKIFFHKHETQQRPSSVRYLYLFILVSAGFLIWLGLADALLGFLAEKSEARDKLGRIFLVALTAGIAASVFYRRFKRGDKSGGYSGTDHE